jgi:flagellar biogenesis protein FliO
MDVFRQVLSVLLVFSLLAAALWMLRRGGKVSFAGRRVMGNTKSMATVERLALTPQHTLHIVRIHGREVLLATHPQGCSVVTMAAEQAMGAKA